MKVGARKGVIRVDFKKNMAGGGRGVSGQPENPPGYATGTDNYALFYVRTCSQFF